MAGKLSCLCLLLFALVGRLWCLPRTSEERSPWSPVNDEDAKLNLEPLANTRPFQQTLTRRLGGTIDDNPSKAGLGPSSFSGREYVKESPIGNVSRNMLLRRLWESARNQYKKRRNLSQCFWKYCV